MRDGNERAGDAAIAATASEPDLVTREVFGAVVAISRGPNAGVRLRLEEPSLTIGSGPLCGLRLTDPKVSREHLQLQVGPKGLLVRDRGSKNGTWLGNVQVNDVVLLGDASLKVGSSTIEVTLDAKPTLIVVSREEHFGRVYACSLAMRHLFASVSRAAQSEISILLEGESGVGKELLARAIHEHSPRRDGPFVAIDCGAIPPELIESELFGHERGAFTGAERGRAGLFEQADGGTVFLDELGELPIELQPKLLRVLQEREIRPVGRSKAKHIDVRVLAATNRNLRDLCAEKAFRDDLFYRVAQLRVRVPSLRERTDDIAPLATQFLRELTRDEGAQLPPDILSMLDAYAWPGNVRELRNVVSRIALLDARDRSELFDVTGTLRRDALAATQEDLSAMPYQDARRIVLERFDTSYFPAVIARAGGVIVRAAAMSGLPRSSFYRLLERLGGAKGRGDGEEP